MVSNSNDSSPEEIRQRHRMVAEAVVPKHTELFIDDEWISVTDGAVFQTTDPTTGEELSTVAQAKADDVDQAVAAARTAYESTWSSYSSGDRQQILTDIADVIEAHRDELAKLETLDNGKTVGEATNDVQGAVEQFRYFVGVVRSHRGTTMYEPTQSGRVIHEPYRVVGQIVLWNFPFLIASWKLAPALAAALLSRGTKLTRFANISKQPNRMRRCPRWRHDTERRHSSGYVFCLADNPRRS